MASNIRRNMASSCLSLVFITTVLFSLSVTIMSAPSLADSDDFDDSPDPDILSLPTPSLPVLIRTSMTAVDKQHIDPVTDLSSVVDLDSGAEAPSSLSTVQLQRSLDVGFEPPFPDVPWCPSQCDCFNYHETVDCSRRSLSELPPLPPTVRRLYLEGNQLEKLNETRLGAAANLSVLIVEDNRLTEFNADLLLVCRLLHIQELDLSGNQIRTFSIGTRSTVATRSCSSSTLSLKELNLSHNRLTTIPCNLSMIAPNLEILLLSHNEITSAAFDASYSLMTSLRYVDLGHNDIRSLFVDDLDPLRWSSMSSTSASSGDRPSIDSLNLADCGLVNIDATAFDGLDNLTSLTLSRCMANQSSIGRALASSSFRQHLLRLDLSETFIGNLTVDLVGDFYDLVGLFASYCDLRSIDPELFRRLPDLETIDVDGGRLDKIDGIGQLTRLRRLSARLNQLEDLVLGHVDTLELVDLSYNRFRRLATGWLGGTDVQLVNVSHNEIVSIERDAITPDSVIATLDLSYNHLSTFPDLGSVKLSRLDLSHNGMTVIAEGVFDSLHDSLNELDLSFNELHEFPAGVFLEFRLLQYLSLAHNSLGQAFRAGREKLGNLFDSLQLLQVLDLSYNGITVIRPTDLLASLRHLNTLYIEGNLIRDMIDAGLASTRVLAKLVIAGNQLNVPDAGLLSRLEYLEDVDFAENPFECTCALSAFLDWSNTTTVTIVGIEDITRYQCNFPPILRGQSIFGPAGHRRCTGPSASLPGYQSIDTASASAHDHESTARSSAVYGGLAAVACLTGAAATITAGALICRYGRLFQRVKGLRYRWQIRYREVSAVETSIDQKN